MKHRQVLNDFNLIVNYHDVNYVKMMNTKDSYMRFNFYRSIKKISM
jgi:hypothetical protein